MRTRTLAIVAGLAAGTAAVAQDRFVVADRTNNALYVVWDLNHNGVIDEPGELSLWFSAANAQGTLSIDTPNALAAGPGGRVVLGDLGTSNRNVYGFLDFNADGDAQDLSESAVVADATNSSAVSFAVPTGVAWDPQGNLYVVNAGNASGNDGIYRLTDLNGDGDYQDPGEITDYVTTGAFGAGNGPYGPQEIVFVPGSSPAVGFVRNSSANLHGVYRFVDLSGNGRADDAGEFTAWFDSTNQSGVTVSAGFAIDLDNATPALGLYFLQTATGAVDQLYRLADLNGDGDANDPGEAVLAYSTAEANFSGVDIVSLTDGRVLMSDSSGKRIIALADLNGNGSFMDEGERTTFFANTGLQVADLRQFAPLPPVCQANCDGSTTPPVLNVLDFNCFANAFAAGSPAANCDSSTSEPVLNVLDFNCFVNRFSGGCP